MLSQRPGALWVAAAAAATLLGAAAAPAEGKAPDPHVVVALVDTGINPYHPEFADAGRTAHPSAFLPGYPPDAPALGLRCQARSRIQSACSSDFGAVQERTLHWIPGTRVVGAISFGHAWGPNPILDDSGHGTMVASLAAGRSLGACGQCLLVVVEGLGPEGLEWAIRQPWIDVVVNAWGSSAQAPPPDHSGLLDRTRAFAERGGTVAFAANPGLGADGWAQDALTGADWHLVVGAVDGDGPVGRGARPLLSVQVPLPAACHADRSAACFGRDTSAAAAFAAGGVAQLLLQARRHLGDEGAGPRGAVDGQGVAAQGRPIPRNTVLADGRLARAELWALLAAQAEATPLLREDVGLGLLPASSAASAGRLLSQGRPPECLELQAAAHADGQARRAKWGDWADRPLGFDDPCGR